MSLHRKTCRAAIVAALADGTTGFNAQLAAVAVEHGIQAFDLEWAPPSRNVIYGNLEDPEIKVSEESDAHCATVHTTRAVRRGHVNSKHWSVEAVVTVHLRFSKFQATDVGYNQPDFSGDYEKFAAATEAALSEVFDQVGMNITAALRVNVVGELETDISPVSFPDGDGHSQKVTLTIQTEVHL